MTTAKTTAQIPESLDIVLQDKNFDSKRSKTEIANFLEKLAGLDLEPMIFRTTHEEVGEGWTVEKADQVEIWYRQFLLLNFLYYGERSIVPTADVDKMWHAHILDTEKYDEDCQHLFGFKLQHFPYMGLRGAEDKQNLERSFVSTVKMYQKFFSTDYQLLLTCGSTGCGPHPGADFSRPAVSR